MGLVKSQWGLLKSKWGSLSMGLLKGVAQAGMVLLYRCLKASRAKRDPE